MINISEISNKALEKGNNKNQDQTFDLLEKLNIEFSCVSNDVVETMEECEKLNKVIEVQGASHIFFGMHDEYAQLILDTIQSEVLAAV